MKIIILSAFSNTFLRIAIGDINAAEAQLAYLEERFKLRVKTGHAAIPLPFPMPGTLSTAQAATANAAAAMAFSSGTEVAFPVVPIVLFPRYPRHV